MVPWPSFPGSPVVVDAVHQLMVVPGLGAICHEPARPSPANLNLHPALRWRAMVEHSILILSILNESSGQPRGCVLQLLQLI